MSGEKNKSRRTDPDTGKAGEVKCLKCHKPEVMHEMIERLVHGPRLELFARERRPGWDAWGNEVGKLGSMP